MAKKQLKRIEINQKLGPARLRASRTGGVSAAVSPAKGITLNTKHGARLSKTYKGLTLGLQNWNSVLRGRWSSKGGRVNLNLSKSGLSSSVKGSIGTFNLANPKRSSARIAGVQIRGKNAATIAAMGLMMELVFWALRLAVVVAVRLALFAVWLLMLCWRLLKVCGSLLLFGLFDLPAQLKKKSAKPPL